MLQQARAQTAMGMKFFNCESHHVGDSKKRKEKRQKRETRAMVRFSLLTLKAC